MPPDLAASFAAHGWLHLPGHLLPPVVSDLRAASARLLAPTLLAARQAPSSPTVLQLPEPEQRAPIFGAPTLTGPLAALARELLCCARVQHLESVLLVKPPRCTGRVGWHRDHTYLGFLDRPVVTLRLAITAEPEASGCLEVLDGSHRWPATERLRVGADQLGDDTTASLGEDPEATVAAHRRALPSVPGDLTAHHGLLVHGSGPNPTAQPRVTLLLRLADAASRVDLGALDADGRARVRTTPDAHLDPATFPILP